MNDSRVQGMQFDVAGFSEQGPRSDNQDAYLVESFGDRRLLAVADGMGGEKSGRVAADTALIALRELAPIRSIDEAKRAVREANASVVRASDGSPDLLGGMGCALGLLSLTSNGDGTGWIAAHVGDVRILSRSPDGVLRVETRDHTPAFARWEAGEISLDEIPDSAGANRLQRAVGRGGEADASWLPAAPGWSWLMISDGVYKAMRLDELGDALTAPTADAACDSIRRKVNERGADDNFTAVVVRALGASSPPIYSATDPAPMNRIAPMPKTERSGSLGFVMGLALAALALGGFAAWTARGAAADIEEMQRLRVEVDSLRGLVEELLPPIDPFGPSLTPPSTTDTATRSQSQ